MGDDGDGGSPVLTTRRVAVAFSGGRDSTALLHATVRAAKPLGIDVIALHVHHGLSEYADSWLAHAEAFCARLRVQGAALEFAATRLSARPSPGESIEAWARTARYAALRAMALRHDAPLVLLAHHQRDQAETLLLQALRGAGPAGLAGMPRAISREGVTWVRPWLERPRDAIDHYVKTHRLAHIDDDSNNDTRFARNRLRSAVWPALIEAYPAADTSLASAARWAQEASAALDELATIDLSATAPHGPLELTPWRALSAARRSNALRAWLRQQVGRAAPSTLVLRLMDELMLDRPARWPLPDGELRSHRRVLEHVSRVTRSKASGAASPDAARMDATSQSIHMAITRAGTRRLPGGAGALRFERVERGGVALARLQSIELRERSGGELFQTGSGRPARALKKQFQTLGISAWDRRGPLVYSGGDLLFVPGLGIDHRMLAGPGEPQMMLTWLSPSAGT